jgi:hypothetical protein
MLAPCDIQRQKQSRGSVKESIIRPVDSRALKVAIEVILRVPQRIAGTIEMNKHCFAVH